MGMMMLTLFVSTTYAQEKAAGKSRNAKGSVVKEVDSFHELLHPIVHDAYPNNDFGSIRKAIPGLIRSARLIENAKLLKELSTKRNTYRKESKKLVRPLKDLDGEIMLDERPGRLFSEMHDTFENIMQIVR